MAIFNVASLFGSRAKEVTPSELPPDDSKKILFVCTGNIARSASAEYIAKAISDDRAEWEFDSAGVGAVVGSGVAEYIDEELRSRNVSFENHVAKQITEELVEDSALVLVMDREHLNWIVREWPQYRNKVHLLRQMSRLRASAGRRVDPISYMYQQDQSPLAEDEIADPYGRGPAPAKQAVEEVEEALTVVIPWLGL